jgi:hypothetical protein
MSSPAIAGDNRRQFPHFSAVPDCQHHDLFSVVVLQGDIGAMPDLNHPFAEFWGQIADRRPTLRMFGERFYALPDRFEGALGSVSALGNEKGMETSDIEPSRLRPFQSWPLGGARSLPASSLAIQSSAASADACSSGRLIMIPRRERVLPQLFTLRFAF